MQRVIPSERTIRRKTIEPLYNEKIMKIKLQIGENPVYFIIDETTDSANRYVLSILVGALNGLVTRPMLLTTNFLEKTNNLTVSHAFINACSVLWSNNIQFDKVWLVVSDQASYMLKACENLKLNFPSLNHITCLAHCLNRVCETIRNKFNDVNSLISNMKKILIKCPQRRQLYWNKTGLKLPKYPCITRWGTWLNAAFYYKEN